MSKSNTRLIKEKKNKKSIKDSNEPEFENDLEKSIEAFSNGSPIDNNNHFGIDVKDISFEQQQKTESKRKKIDNYEKRRESKSLLEVDYVAPPPVSKKDIQLLHNIDEKKMKQLKEAFLIFDFNHDGVIGREDLRTTLKTLGKEEVKDDLVESMLSEALHPLDFDAFVVLLGCKTIELDPEEVIKDALSRWDYDGTGWINEHRIRHDLMTWGDKFTSEEVDIALEDAPIHEDFRESAEMKKIDYIKFCKILGGLRSKQ